jgi:4'-phosphopantetheinyl transferase
VTRDDRNVRVYCFSVDLEPEFLAELEALLSEQELERAARFRFARDRSRYVAAHGTLRRILGLFVQRAPTELSFTPGPQGKPALEPGQIGEPVHFNLSRSGNLALVAVAGAGEVGVDLEHVRPLDAAAIARRIFAPAEHAALLALPEAEQLWGFLRYWTRKEAVVKATGRGLSLPLRSFVLSAEPGESPEEIRPEGGPPVWVSVLPSPQSGYAAALACTFAPATIRFGWWDRDGRPGPAGAAFDKTVPVARTLPRLPARG